GAGDDSARAVAHLGGMLHDPVDGERDEIVELDLWGRDQSRDRRAHRALDQEVLRNWAVDDPHRPEFLVQASRRLEHPAVGRDVFADEEDALVTLHLLHEAFGDGLDVAHGLHVGADRSGGGFGCLHHLHRCSISLGVLSCSSSRSALLASAARASRFSSSVSRMSGGTGTGWPLLSTATNVRYAVLVCRRSPLSRSSL